MRKQSKLYTFILLLIFFLTGSVGVWIGSVLGTEEALMRLHLTVSGHHIAAGLS